MERFLKLKEDMNAHAMLDYPRECVGIITNDFSLKDWNLNHQYEIYQHWRHRYEPNITHNTEHIFGLEIPSEIPIRISPSEHIEYEWVKINNAKKRVFSWTNVIALEKLPEKIKEQPLPSIYPKLINELINQHLIAQQAYKEKLDQNKKVLSELNKSKEQIMAKFWLKNFLDRQAKKKNIKAFYKNYLKTFKISKEFNASHILVKEKKTATEIIKKLNNKSNFTDLAKQFSIGPSGKNGGKLNWFGPGQMVQSFEEAAFALNKGQITQKPVQTKFGFHIIILNDIRESKPKKLSEIEQQIIKLIKKK